MIRFLRIVITALLLATPPGFARTGPAAAPEKPKHAAKPLPAADQKLADLKPADKEPVLVHGMPTKVEGDDALKLQIFLDQAMFGPGVVDGRPGLFTRLAVASWNESHGVAPDDWGTVLDRARAEVPEPQALAVVPEGAMKWIDPSLPTAKAEQAKRKLMAYRSVAEFMSERYHTSEDYLIHANGKAKMANLKPRDTLMVPNITPFLIEKVTGVIYAKDDVLSHRHVVVDTKRNQARVFEQAPAALVVTMDGAEPQTMPNRGLVASFPITPGQEKFIKYGQWELWSCIELPMWRFDQQLLDTGKRSKDGLKIPPGPNSPVGILWAGLSHPGIGMHGTSDPQTIGRARSHGCIRMANWDAIRLPLLIRPGATVEIR